MKKISYLLSLSFILIVSCGKEEAIEEIENETDINIIYQIPFSISPLNNAIFYSYEEFKINWQLPDGLTNSELQLLESSTPVEAANTSRFENLPIIGYGGQTIHRFSYLEDSDNPITETIYIGYRIRARDLGPIIGYSEWSEIKTFTIVPLISLNKNTVHVVYDFDFVTEEVNNKYYSGIVEKMNYNLSNIAAENNLDITKIKVVRPVSIEANFLTLTDDGQNPFHPITFGYSDSIDQNDSAYPFDPLGQVFPGSFEESPIPAQIYNGFYRNLNDDLRNYNLKMAYLLIDNPNTQHQVQLNFEFDIYLED